jgi:hypothetical protein
VDFPFPIHRVSGEDAFTTLQEIRIRGNGVSLILGSEKDFQSTIDDRHFKDQGTVQEWLSNVDSLDPLEPLIALSQDKYYQLHHERWPFFTAEARAHYQSAFRPFPSQTLIATFPCDAPWMIPYHFDHNLSTSCLSLTDL